MDSFLQIVLWICYTTNMDDKKKEWYRAYMKARKANFKARGICPNCEKRPAKKGHVCCVTCLENKKFSAIFGKSKGSEQIRLKMLNDQDGLCAICGKENDGKLVVDHSHSEMFVRGLLCQNCNVGLGKFMDSPIILAKAIEYLNRDTRYVL